jgi:serine protease Do
METIMTKLYFRLLLSSLFYLSSTTLAVAEPSQALIFKLNSQVLRVQVGLANGSYGLGSGVVVAKDQVVTNCHVVANAVGISVVSNGASFSISAIKPDWKHDLCVLKADGLNVAPVNMGSSKDLKYEQPVFNIGYPGFIPVPVSNYGVVKGLFPMDDSVIVRATSTFRLGASGGGVFDESGNLIGIITLKSPGRNAFYYNMPVEWVQTLLEQPEQSITAKSELPFWAKKADEWPFFMKVVQPYLTEDWKSLQTIAQAWTAKEPETSEAWFFLAAAEFGTDNQAMAEEHLHKVVAMNHQHSQALYYLGLIAEARGNHTEALSNIALLHTLDEAKAKELKLAMGIVDK